MTGTDKSTNGALRLSLVLKKSSFANTQDTTKTQPKLKSINSMLFSENKLRSGLVFKRQTLRSSRSYLPKNQEPHCSMETVLRTNGLQGQSQLGKMFGFKKVKTFSFHYLSLRQ